MKQHAFIRTNVPRVLRTKMHTETNLELPNFGQFFYFLFAPTMIYKDEYPRTRHIRWKFVLHNIAEMFAAMWFYAVIAEKFLILIFNDICLRQFTLGEIIAPIFSNVVPGVSFMLLSFYGVLHSCQNAFAEILRFGDRMFYKVKNQHDFFLLQSSVVLGMVALKIACRIPSNLEYLSAGLVVYIHIQRILRTDHSKE